MMTATGMTFKQFLVDYSIQVQLPDELTHQILTWSDEQIPDEIVYDEIYGREDDPHITILYRLTPHHLPLLQQFLSKEKPIEIALSNISLFNKDYFDVLKIDVESQALHLINQRLINEMQVEKQYPIYIPHVTLAFLKKNTSDFLANNNFFASKSFVVDQLYFSSRNGSKIKIDLGEKNEK